MNDPVSVLNQLRSYAAEGRLEMAEVMAEELSATLARKKDGNLPIQEMLVEALREHAVILSQRKKWKPALKAAKTHTKEASILAKIRAKTGYQPTEEDLRTDITDSLTMGRIQLHLGSASRVMKSLARPLALGNIDAHLLAIHANEVCRGSLKGAKKPVKSLIRTLLTVGPPERTSSGLVLTSADGMQTAVSEVLTSLGRWTMAGSGLATALSIQLRGCLDVLSSQVDSIEREEQAANAKLQAAINSLQPVVNYHEYSKSSR